jgi:hypothetical protein
VTILRFYMTVFWTWLIGFALVWLIIVVFDHKDEEEEEEESEDDE